MLFIYLYLLLLFWQGINSTCHMSHVTTPLDHQPLPSPWHKLMFFIFVKQIWIHYLVYVSIYIIDMMLYSSLSNLLTLKKLHYSTCQISAKLLICFYILLTPWLFAILFLSYFDDCWRVSSGLLVFIYNLQLNILHFTILLYILFLFWFFYSFNFESVYNNHW